MRRIFLPLFALSLSLITLTSLSAKLDTAIVGADAQWVMHIDLNALRESAIGKELVTQAIALQAEALKNQKLPVQVDVPKLLETIGAVTAYGANLSQDPKLIDGALIFQGTPDLRKIAEGAIAQATVSYPDKVMQLGDLPFESYSLAGELMIAFPPEPIILISKSKAQLLAARKVFKGDAPSLAKTKNSALHGLIRNQTGSFVLAASVVPSSGFFPEDVPQARILQMAKSASVELGEENKQTFAHVQLLASSDDAADKLTKILQGITAMISLAETTDKYLAEFLKSVTVAREKNTVTLHLAYSSERLIAMFNEVKEAQRAERTKAPPKRPAPKIDGEIVGTWTADQDLGANSVTAETMATKTIANVALTSGSLIILTGVRQAEEYARIDRVELTPAGGGQPLRFEAEHMNLRGYGVENSPAASGGRLIAVRSPRGTAQFQFPGADGVYDLTLRYCDENDGKSTYTVSVKAPEAVEAATAP